MFHFFSKKPRNLLDEIDLFESISQIGGATPSSSRISLKPNEDPQSLLKKLLKLMFLNANKEVHNTVSCDSCEKKAFEECKNFDLCSKCYDIQNSGKKHSKTHAMIMFKKPISSMESSIYESFVDLGLEKLDKILQEKEIVHREATCAGCNTTPITGLRFKCDECFNFDYCLNCFKSKKNLKNHDSQTHKMLVLINSPKSKFSFDDLIFEEKLGKGCFGEVYKAKIVPFNNKICACKIFYIDNLLKEYSKNGQSMDQNVILKSFLNELNSLNEVRTPHLIDYYGHGIDIDTKGAMKFFLLFEYMPNGSLEDALNPDSRLNDELSLRRRFQMALDIISGIRRFHSKKLIHKDIKPDNILITGGVRAKIGDLGVSKLMNSPNQFISDQIAPRHYRAPDEVMTTAFDIYSFGLVINHLFTGVRHKEFLGIHIVMKESEYFQEVIRECLNKNAKERPSAQKIESYFEKFDKFFWENVEDKKKYIEMGKDEKNDIFRSILSRFEKNYKF